MCRFKQADLNKASRPQAHSVEIDEVNEDKSEYSSNNEEVYIQEYHINIDGGGKKQDHDTWFLDTGATHHLAYWKDWLEDYQELSTPLRVVFEDNGQKLEVGKGNICLIMANDNHIKITDLYCILGEAKHLLPVGRATNNGLTIEFTENRAMIHLHKNKSKAIVCPKQGHIYPGAARQSEALSTEVCHNHNEDNVSSTYLWLCKLGHIHTQAL